jgi:short-subunit dehydrogenase
MARGWRTTVELTGARVAITGASSGIGESTALAFARAGAHVHLAARRTDRLEAVAEQCRAHGVEATAHTVDVRDGDAVTSWAAEVEGLGGCDVAIANAGVMWLGPLLDMPTDELRHQYDVNVHGVLHTLQAFGRPMRERGRGVLMPVSSVLSVANLPRYAAYCGSKHAVRAMAASLRIELAGTGVEVVHVLPGATESEIHAHMDVSRLPLSTREAKRVPASQVAAAMVRAARRPKAEVLCDGQGRLLYWATRLAPALVDAVLPKAMALRRRR